MSCFSTCYRTRPFLAGASLWLCALKPHLFVPFGVVLLVWILVSRSYKILAGAAVALAASCALTYLLDPTAWADYSQMMRTAGLENGVHPLPHRGAEALALSRMPCGSSTWRRCWAPSGHWAITGRAVRHGTGKNMAICWCLFRSVAAPYSWVYDGGLAIPALLQGAYPPAPDLL